MEKILKLWVLDDGSNPQPFPSNDDQIEIGDFKYNSKRMGGAPNITATVMYSTCLDDVWTDNVYTEFNGEKYYLKQTPTSSYSSDDTRYKHDLELVSERVILDNVYFFDVVSSINDHKPVSNSTKVVFPGNIHEFVARINASLVKSGLMVVDESGQYVSGYRVVVDDGITSEDKLVSFDDQFLSNVIQEIYNTYEIPYYFDGKTVHVGYYQKKYGEDGEEIIIPTLEYGVDNALMSITKTNANFKIVNRATAIGSTDNLPFYYPNNSPKGMIGAECSNVNLEVEIVNYDKFSNLVEKGDVITYISSNGSSTNGQEYNIYYEDYEKAESETFGLITKKKITYTYSQFATVNTANVPYRFKFDLASDFSKSVTLYDSVAVNIKFTRDFWEREFVLFGNFFNIPLLVDGNIVLSLDENITFPEAGVYGVEISIITRLLTMENGDNVGISWETLFEESTNGWVYKDGLISLSDYGLKIKSGTPSHLDSITQVVGDYIDSSTNLLPSVYRETYGEERFYNATNGTYTIDGAPVVFNNPYIEGKPKEHIFEVPDLKPTIKETTNAYNERIDMFSAIAFDEYDNNDTYEDDEGSTNFKHPYFFVKLKRLGFNLFDCAIEQEPMKFSMTSGNCGSCEFEVAVAYDDNGKPKNLVQVDENGDLIYQDHRVLCGAKDFQGEVEPQDIQQDTTDNEVWIALFKEENTYGMLMPYAPTVEKDESGEIVVIQASHRPSTDDTFVILNISLPIYYVTQAEKRLEQEIIKYLKDNNDEKFNFNVEFSRIYFEENPSVLADINENSKFTVRYNNKDYALYVNSFQYGMTQSEVLPQITVELNGELTISQNALQNAVNEVKYDVSKAISSIDVVSVSEKRLIRKDSDDYALGNIEFKKDIKVEQDATILGNTTFGDFQSGLYDGIGARIDSLGNAEFQSLRVRSALEILELVVNRLTAIDGDQLLTESDTIERVEDLGGGIYGLYLKSKWDGYITALSPNDVLKGKYTELDGNVSVQKTSWARINCVFRESNYIEVTLYPDSEVPGGTNYPPIEQMNVARWGNQTDVTRQRCVYLSSTEGRICVLQNVTAPIIDASNYGTTIGTVPEFIKELGFNTDEQSAYIYTKGIFAEYIYQVDHEGKPTPQIVDRGVFSQSERYYAGDKNENGVYEVSDVWYNGCKWRCAKTTPEGEVPTIPSFNNTDWAMVEGDPSFYVYFEEMDTVYDPDNFNATLTLVCKKYNEDISDLIGTDIEVRWTRYSEDANGNPRTELDSSWNVQHKTPSRQLELTDVDLDMNLGYMPKVIRFTATATLHDETQEVSVGFEN